MAAERQPNAWKNMVRSSVWHESKPEKMRTTTFMWTRDLDVHISVVDVDTFARGTLNNILENVST
jgi:hypothetical protein